MAGSLPSRSDAERLEQVVSHLATMAEGADEAGAAAMRGFAALLRANVAALPADDVIGPQPAVYGEGQVLQ